MAQGISVARGKGSPDDGWWSRRGASAGLCVVLACCPSVSGRAWLRGQLVKTVGTTEVEGSFNGLQTRSGPAQNPAGVVLVLLFYAGEKGDGERNDGW